MSSLLKFKRKSGLSNIITAIFMFLIFLAITASFMSLFNAYYEEFREISEKQTKLYEKTLEKVEFLDVILDSEGFLIKVRNVGSVTIILIKYYVRDVNNELIDIGDLQPVTVRPGDIGQVRIPGVYEQTGNYLISLISLRGSAFKTTYPFQKPYIPLNRWDLGFIKELPPPLSPIDYSYIDVGYIHKTINSYPQNYVVHSGTYKSGTLPDDVMYDDSKYFIISSEASPSLISETYYPTNMNILTGSLTSGTVDDLTSNDNVSYVIIKSVPTSFTTAIYFTNEEYVYEATKYYKLMITIPGPPYTFIKSCSIERGWNICEYILEFLYPIEWYEGYTIPRGTWRVGYYAWYEVYIRGGISFIWGTAYIDISVISLTGERTLVSEFARTFIGPEPETYEGIDIFPGYEVVANDKFLKISVTIEVSVISTSWGTLSIYFAVNTLGSYILASNTWAETYGVLAEFVGISNTFDWESIEWGADIRTNVSGVRAELQLYNYATNSYPTSGSGYISISSVPTSDTYYSQTISTNPEDFRDPDTGEFKIRINASKDVVWNEGFYFYIDWMPFKVTYYLITYRSVTEFIFSNLITQNISRLYIMFDIETNSSTFTAISIWDYVESSWVKLWEGSGTHFTDTIAITTFIDKYISQEGEARILIDSKNNANFDQLTDLLKITLSASGVPSLIVGKEGYSDLYAHIYSLNETVKYDLPEILKYGFAFESVGTDVYVVFGGNSLTFAKIDLTANTSTILASLPEFSVNSLLSYIPDMNLISYIPDKTVSPIELYLYDPVNNAWVESFLINNVYPLNISVGYRDSVFLIEPYQIEVFNLTTGTITKRIPLPIHLYISGANYDSDLGLLLISYYSGEVIAYDPVNDLWYYVKPELPGSEISEGSRLTSDPTYLFYLKPYSSMYYYISKNNLEYKILQ